MRPRRSFILRMAINSPVKGSYKTPCEILIRGILSRIFTRSRMRNIKKRRPARIARIYRAWEVDGAQFRFLRIPSNFPEMRENAFRTFPSSFAFSIPGEKHSTSPLEQQRRLTVHARGKFIESNFPRSLSRSPIVLTRSYVHADTREPGCIRMRESRVGYLPRIHQADCSA